jgi:putative transposase
VLLRLTYLGVTNALAMLRLLPMSDQAKDAQDSDASAGVL